ncbi:MAG TPA: hypothetical protein VN426_16790 [Syntrophomonadaceae bacterium]|nr:hypothetical protein [Syntrophomonadaceae bacterium]
MSASKIEERAKRAPAGSACGATSGRWMKVIFDYVAIEFGAAFYFVLFTAII